MKTLVRDLNAWFFGTTDPRLAALLRFGFCGTFLSMLWDFYPVMHLLFGHGGLYGTLEKFPFPIIGIQFLLFRFNTDAALETWFWGSIVVGSLGLIGLGSRVSLLLTYISML